MTMKNVSLLLLWFGLGIGNFAWAALTAWDWKEAFERSFFQGIALLAVYLSLIVKG